MGGWERLIRFVPLGERISQYGEPVIKKGQIYLPNEHCSLETRIFTQSGTSEGQFLKTNEVKLVEKIISPIGFSPLVLSPVANYYKNYHTTRISFPDVMRVKYKTLKSVGGPNSILPILNDPYGIYIESRPELAAIIGKKCHYETSKSCLDNILGFTCANNIIVTTGRLYPQDFRLPSIRAYNSFCVLGPWIVKPSILDFDNLDISLTYGSDLVHAGNTSDLVYKTCDLISWLSEGINLHPGTVVLTGSPEPTSLTERSAKMEVIDGKKLTVSIKGIGNLSTTIRLVPYPKV